MVGTVIGAVAPSVVGGLMGSDASSSAANTQSQGAADALALQRQVYNETVARNAPYLKTGTAASDRLGYLMGLNPTQAASSYSSPQQPSYSNGFQTDNSSGPQQIAPGVYAGSVLAQYPQAMWSAIAAQSAGIHMAGSSNGALAAELDRLGRVDASNPAKFLPGLEASSGVYSGRGFTQPQPVNNTPIPQVDNSSDPAFGSLARPFSMSDFEQDPGYAFRVSEGKKALERSAAARGTSLGGAQLKALTNYGQGMGSQEYQAAYNRFNTNQGNLFSRLSSLANSGQSAANNTSSAGSNFANQGSNLITGSANAQSANQVNQGNIWGNVASGLNIGDIFKQTSSSGLPYADIINANPSIF